MQIYDIIMLIVLISATLFGAWKGLAWQVASLGAIFISYYVSVRFRDDVGRHISASEPWNTFLAMLLLYVGTSLVIWLAFRFVSSFIERVRLKAFDRQIGALFGFAKGIVLCVIITLFAVTLLGENHRRTIIDSRSGHYIAQLLDEAHGIMPSEIHDVVHPYVHDPIAKESARRGTRSAGEKSRPLNDLIPVDELLQALEEELATPGEGGALRR